jgi:hypothetical protein
VGISKEEKLRKCLIKEKKINGKEAGVKNFLTHK